MITSLIDVRQAAACRAIGRNTTREMQNDEAWGRRHRSLETRAATFIKHYGPALSAPAPDPGPDAPRALFISGAPPRTETELCLMKALSVAGWVPIPVVMLYPDILKAYYATIAPRELHEWSSYLPDPATLSEDAEAAVRSCRSLEELKGVEANGVRLGGNAVSFARREQRIGTVDFTSETMKQLLVLYMSRSMAAARAAAAILDRIKPALVFAVDTVYTPKGEIFDTCLARGIPFLRWFPAHKSNALLLKRYSLGNRDSDLSSLSAASWTRVKAMHWSDALRDDIERELHAAYATGDWYSESATQFDRRLADERAVRAALAIDPGRRLAVVFAHISWDASFGRGRDLFGDYEEWLVETVRAACANPRVQWLIKVHPAHTGKSEVDFWQAETSEDRILRERVGPLPPHVRVVPAGTDISTYSLFPLIDWAVTVRGTPGLEAARLGIPVLTGGTGRYDGRGFTIDSDSRQAYLDRLANIENIPRLSPHQVELANRFAFGLFRLRPLPLTTVTLEYGRQFGADAFFNGVHIRNRTLADWQQASDLNAFVEWATWSDAEDFLLPPHEARLATQPGATSLLSGLSHAFHRWRRERR
jgi:hypothetical protein